MSAAAPRALLVLLVAACATGAWSASDGELLQGSQSIPHLRPQHPLTACR